MINLAKNAKLCFNCFSMQIKLNASVIWHPRYSDFKQLLIKCSSLKVCPCESISIQISIIFICSVIWDATLSHMSNNYRQTFFSQKVTPKTIFSCRYVKSLKRYKKCNLTPWMVSNYNKNIAKKFVVKSCLC